MPKISQLPAATSVAAADLFAIVQGSTTKKATASLVNTYISAALVITEAQVTGLTASLALKMDKASNLSDVANVATSRINLGLNALTDGQLWIGDTAANPVAANITAGTNISVTNGAGSIVIAATGSGSFSWTNVAGVTQSIAINSGYIANNAGLVTLTLPITAAVGSEVVVVGNGAGGWTIAQNGGQVINVGNVASTVGVGGSVSSSNRYDSIRLVCTVADSTWVTVGGVQGVLTIV
ncbi:MAG: hypothetical protein WC753_04755 [Candidatus Gracilibacteria bacterium]|jgi:hypothetical protein